jgi:hypothetical protein
MFQVDRQTWRGAAPRSGADVQVVSNKNGLRRAILISLIEKP